MDYEEDHKQAISNPVDYFEYLSSFRSAACPKYLPRPCPHCSVTLTAKQLQKPFDQAVIAPFLKAYSKRVGAAATLEDVTCVKVDDVMIGDMTIAASVVLLTGETVDTEIFLRASHAPPKPAFEYSPFGAAKDGPSARAAAGHRHQGL